MKQFNLFPKRPFQKHESKGMLTHILYNIDKKNVLLCFVEIANFSGVHLPLKDLTPNLLFSGIYLVSIPLKNKLNDSITYYVNQHYYHKNIKLL